MRNPQLAADRFLPDRVLSIERIVNADALAILEGAMRSDQAGKFRSRRRLSLRLSSPESDLSRFDRLAVPVLNLSHASLLVGMKLIHGSPSGVDDSDKVSVSGGRECLPPGQWVDLKFPRESFGSYGTSVGWTGIREIELTFGWEKDHSGPDEIEICLAGVDGETRLIPTGPRLTEQGLIELLNHGCADLTAFVGGQGGPAVRERAGPPPQPLPPYTPGNSGLLVPPPHPYPIDTAEEILDGTIMGQRVGHPITWDANPLGVLEWTHFLHRHHFARELVKMLARTGDERYARALETIVQGWIHSNPVPLQSNGGAGPAWETLSAAWRLREWLWIVGIAWRYESFRSQTRMVMLRSIWEHATSLMHHTGHPNNWIIVESCALTLAGLCFPVFRQSRRWIDTGMERLVSAVRKQFFSDGVHFEISPLYHAICLHALFEVKHVASAAATPYPEELEAVIENATDYLVSLCRPNFTWPSLNDSGGATGDYCAFMRMAAEISGRSDLMWIGSRGEQGRPPEKRSKAFSEAGIAVMRSHYGTDAHFLVFRAGPTGAFHAHEDYLSLDVTAYGQPRLVDPGITSYAPDPLTRHYREPLAHNVVLIDRKGPDRSEMTYGERVGPAGKNFHWREDEQFEVATGIVRGTWNGYECVVCRSIFFVRRAYWIVRDMIIGAVDHEVTTCWQFYPGRIEMELKTFAATFADARGPGIKIIPLLSPSDFEVEMATALLSPARGWVSINGSDMPATMVMYTSRSPGRSILVWVLAPFRTLPGSSIQATRQDGPDESLTVEVVFPEGARDLITLEPPLMDQAGLHEGDPHGRITYTGLDTNSP